MRGPEAGKLVGMQRLRAYGPKVDLALVDAVLAEPGSLGPRLVLADELTRLGDPFGPALRGVVEGPEPRFRGEVVAALGERLREWVGEIAELAWRWTGSPSQASRLPPPYSLTRGFVEEVHLRDETLVSHGEALLATWPVRSLLVEGKGKHSARVSSLPLQAFGHLEKLSLRGLAMEDEGARWLAARPELAGLRQLDLSHNLLGEHGMEALYASPYLQGLTALDLTGNQAPLVEIFSDQDWFGGHASELSWTPLLQRLVEAHGRRLWVPEEGRVVG